MNYGNKSNKLQVHGKLIGGDQDGKAKVYIKDAWVVITLGLFLFMIPAENPFRGQFIWRPSGGT